MLGYAQGDASAFETLYARHRAPLYRYFQRQVRDRGVAEELYQDVWVKVIQARDRYTVQARFTTWLYRIAHNRLVDHWRRHEPSALVSLAASDGEMLEAVVEPERRDPARHVAGRELAARLAAAVADLPVPQREAFLLHVEEDMDTAAIATATGVSRETAKSRLRYALGKLRRAVEGEE